MLDDPLYVDMVICNFTYKKKLANLVDVLIAFPFLRVAVNAHERFCSPKLERVAFRRE
jgi:hypothetical protein